MKRDPSKIKCGKCGEKPTTFNERWDAHTIQFCMDSTGAIEEDGELEPGDPTSVYALCNCGHEWKLKGISQIDQLRNN
jgi:hypothetical protein